MNAIPDDILQRMDTHLLLFIMAIDAQFNSYYSTLLPEGRLHTPQELALNVKSLEDIENFLKISKAQALMLNELGFCKSYERVSLILSDLKDAKRIANQMYQDRIIAQNRWIGIQNQTQEECFDIFNKTMEKRQKSFDESISKYY